MKYVPPETIENETLLDESDAVNVITLVPATFSSSIVIVGFGLLHVGAPPLKKKKKTF